MLPKLPRFLFWDIETSHNVVATFQLRNDDGIPHQNILQERFIICVSWKELGKPKITTVITKNRNDKPLCQQLQKFFHQPNAIYVGHNGDSFDRRVVETRMLYHGLDPLPLKLLTLDTLKIARRQFRFNSNRLDYLGAYLGVGQKLHTESGLWLKVLQNDRKAVKQMATYNRHDVELLERVFLKLKPYVVVRRPDHRRCPQCKSTKVQLLPNAPCAGCGGRT